MSRKLNGYVYFIHVPVLELVKIGYSDNHPDYRLQCSQTGSPVALHRLGFVRGTYADEQAFHARFRQHYSHGEWFRLEGDLKDFASAELQPWPPKPVIKNSHTVVPSIHSIPREVLLAIKPHGLSLCRLPSTATPLVRAQVILWAMARRGEIPNPFRPGSKWTEKEVAMVWRVSRRLVRLRLQELRQEATQVAHLSV